VGGVATTVPAFGEKSMRRRCLIEMRPGAGFVGSVELTYFPQLFWVTEDTEEIREFTERPL
jgi:hypothetical protein